MAKKPLFTPMESNFYTAQANRLRRNYGYGHEQNKYDRKLSGLAYGWDREDLGRQYGRAAQTFGDSFNKRGMMDSGNYNHAYGTFQADKQRAFNRLDISNVQKNLGFGMAQDQLWDIKQKSLAELTSQKNAYRKTIASTLAGL